MRVYKRVKKNSRDEAQQEIERLKLEGWKPGPIRTYIDTMYPHQCQLWKDINNKNESEVKNA